jgi:hypothetical protein
MKYTIKLTTELVVEVEADSEDVACARALATPITPHHLDWVAEIATATPVTEDYSAYLDRPADLLDEDDYENG